jgi:fatty-acyl-CoA synthase
MAWIVMKPDRDPLTVEQVRQFCSGQIAHYKVPRYVHIVEGFPMTVTGKVRKIEMRETAVELLNLEDVAATRHA